MNKGILFLIILTLFAVPVLSATFWYGNNDARGYNLTNTSAVASALYCNATGGNCVSDLQASGSGDITAVNTNGPYLYGGATTGAVSLLANITAINNSLSASYGGGGAADGIGVGTVSAVDDTMVVVNGTSATFRVNITTANTTVDNRVTESFLTNLLNSVYATITNVQNWINGNRTATETVLRGYVDSNYTSMLAVDIATNTSLKSYTDSQDLLNVLRTDWTTINDYPTGCSGGEYVQIIGDTLTCVADANSQLSQEQVEDFSGGMWTGNTETSATVTYQDGDGTMDIDSSLILDTTPQLGGELDTNGFNVSSNLQVEGNFTIQSWTFSVNQTDGSLVIESG